MKVRRIRFVFLDRDGVLNRKLAEGQYPTKMEDVKLLPGAALAIAKLNKDRRTVILVTNQRAIGLGLLTEEKLDELHRELAKGLAEHDAHLDAIYFCPHDPSRERCTCRKPASGLFEQAFRDFRDVSGENSVVIGDSLSDIEVGHRLGMRTICIQGETAFRKPGWERASALADAVADSLHDAVYGILERFEQATC